MGEHSEKFNKELENINRKKTQLKNTITEIKNIPEGINSRLGDFPGGAVVNNLPANAGDTGLSPGPGRSHMLWSNKACVPQVLSLRSRAHKPQLLSLSATTMEARTPGAHVPQQEKPPQ